MKVDYWILTVSKSMNFRFRPRKSSLTILISLYVIDHKTLSGISGHPLRTKIFFLLPILVYWLFFSSSCIIGAWDDVELRGLNVVDIIEFSLHPLWKENTMDIFFVSSGICILSFCILSYSIVLFRMWCYRWFCVDCLIPV